MGRTEATKAFECLNQCRADGEESKDCNSPRTCCEYLQKKNNQTAFTSAKDKNTAVVVKDDKIEVAGELWSVTWIGESTDGSKTIESVEDALDGKVQLNDETAFKNPRRINCRTEEKEESGLRTEQTELLFRTEITLTYDGFIYTTMDECPPATEKGSCDSACQDSPLNLPAGWDLVPDNLTIVGDVIQNYPFGTDVVILSNGNGYYTSSSEDPGGKYEDSNLLDKSGGTYKATNCPMKVLMRKGTCGPAPLAFSPHLCCVCASDSDDQEV